MFTEEELKMIHDWALAATAEAIADLDEVGAMVTHAIVIKSR